MRMGDVNVDELDPETGFLPPVLTGGADAMATREVVDATITYHPPRLRISSPLLNQVIAWLRANQQTVLIVAGALLLLSLLRGRRGGSGRRR